MTEVFVIERMIGPGVWELMSDRAFTDEVAQAKHDMERMKKENDASYQQAVGCLDAVKAMLELSQGNGATHRMRDFYGESIIKFIDSSKQKLAARHDADPMPF